MSTSDLSLAEYDALLRNDFSTFVERSFTELNPGTEFARNWHLHVMAYELQRCLLGETRPGAPPNSHSEYRIHLEESGAPLSRVVREGGLR